MSTPAARRLWWSIEPFHGVTVSAIEVVEMYERSGIFDARVGYVAARAAPLGRVSSAVARAAFGGFAPWMVENAVPAAWNVIAPEALLVRRLHAIDQAMWRLLGNDLMRSNDLVAASQLARRAAEHADCSGRVLASAYQSLEWPTFPHLVLWQATAVLREHREDGREAAQMIAGLSGCEPHVLLVAEGASTADVMQDGRGWLEVDWDASVGALRGRGLLTKNGTPTDAGRELMDRIETQTDQLASGAFEVLDEDEQAFLRKTLESCSKRIIEAGEFSYPNDLGVPEPPAGLHRGALAAVTTAAETADEDTAEESEDADDEAGADDERGDEDDADDEADDGDDLDSDDDLNSEDGEADLDDDEDVGSDEDDVDDETGDDADHEDGEADLDDDEDPDDLGEDVEEVDAESEEPEESADTKPPSGDGGRKGGKRRSRGSRS